MYRIDHRRGMYDFSKLAVSFVTVRRSTISSPTSMPDTRTFHHPTRSRCSRIPQFYRRYLIRTQFRCYPRQFLMFNLVQTGDLPCVQRYYGSLQFVSIWMYIVCVQLRLFICQPCCRCFCFFLALAFATTLPSEKHDYIEREDDRNYCTDCYASYGAFA